MDGLPIRSDRIYGELVESLAYTIKSEVELAVEDAGYRIEDYEEGARAGIVTPAAVPWYRRIFAW
jgi:hypothetical protein